MSTVTVLTPHESLEVDGHCVDDLVLVDRESLPGVLGWDLKPQGLCRESECVPVTETDLLHGDYVDLRAAATAVGVTSMLADDTDLVALSVPSQTRSDALSGRRAHGQARVGGPVRGPQEAAGGLRKLVRLRI